MSKILYIGDKYQTIRVESNKILKDIKIHMSLFDTEGVKHVTLTKEDAKGFINFFKSIEFEE